MLEIWMKVIPLDISLVFVAAACRQVLCVTMQICGSGGLSPDWKWFPITEQVFCSSTVCPQSPDFLHLAHALF